MDNYTLAARKEREMALSRNLIDGFLSKEASSVKKATETTNAFTRKTLMENSWMHKILPAEPISPSEFTEDINERFPYKLVPLEPTSRGAMTVQFGTVPNTMYFDAEYYRVPFNRILSPRLTLDVAELLRYRYDIRQVILDKHTKFIELEKDRRFIQAVTEALRMTETMGALGNRRPTPSQIRAFDSGLTRDNLVDAVQIMQSTQAHIPASCALCNTKTYSEFAKWQHDEMGGGSIAEDIILNGIGERNWLGLNWVVSIKHEILPDGFVYFFANPDYLGKHYIVEDLTMWVEQQAYMLTTFQWTMSGAAIGNLSGIAMADFNPTGISSGGVNATFA